MSTRAPTSITLLDSVRVVAPGKGILASHADTVADNQEYTLDQEELIISDLFRVVTVSTSLITVGYWPQIMSRDRCDVASVSNDNELHDWGVLAWIDTGDELGVTLTSGATDTPKTHTETLTGSSTWAWYAIGTQIYVNTNGEEDTLTLQGDVSLGTGPAYIAGFYLIAP